MHMPGRPDGGLDRFGSGPPSELSLESGSSSPRGGARPLPPELNGLGAPVHRIPGSRACLSGCMAAAELSRRPVCNSSELGLKF